MLDPRKIVAWFIVAACGCGGCGYEFARRDGGLFKGIKTLHVEPFVNRTRLVGLEWEVTNALKSELYASGAPRVVSRVEEADAVLTGIVRSLETRVAAVNEHDEVLLYDTTLVVDVNLRGRNPDKPIWRGQMRLTETHSGSRGAVVISSTEFKQGTLNPSDVRQFTDIQLTEAMAAGTRERLMRRFAAQMHQRLIDAF
ncbi:MAG TPA: LptE family protein [Candidatus Acidoferrales bacterium]|nr:LptE family protein [Candidatus Acidoferrales bacterium]